MSRMPGGMPMFFIQPQEPDFQRRHFIPEIVIPARVEKALEFLNHLMIKRLPRAAATDTHVEQLENDKLTPQEEATKQAALDMLAMYFNGNLPPDTWEKLRVDALQKQNKEGGNGKPMKVMRCPQCGGRVGNSDCPLCEGEGTLVIVSGTRNTSVPTE